jgi:hypothetical protein
MGLFQLGKHMDIVGPWLHTFKRGHIRWQGKILAEDSDGFRVQLFSWLSGDRNGCVRMTRKEISEATLYADEGDWLAASEKNFGL